MVWLTVVFTIFRWFTMWIIHWLNDLFIDWLFVYRFVFAGWVILGPYHFKFESIMSTSGIHIYLSIYPSIHLSVCLPTYLLVYSSIYLSIQSYIYLSIYISLIMPTKEYLSIYLLFCLSTYVPTYLSIYPFI